MKKTIGLTLLLLILSASSAHGQGPVCNTGRAQGAVEGALSTCIAHARQTYDVSFSVICDCPGTGITVNVFGAPRCNPNEPCPLFIVVVGTAQLDCDYNVVSATCGFQ
jgi:predicted small secreted protein